jgi:hypothetical protein
VGERGPELFTPSNSGRITPNDQLSSGGNTTIENIYIEVLPNATTGEVIASMDKEELKEALAIPIFEAFEDLAAHGVIGRFGAR